MRIILFFAFFLSISSAYARADVSLRNGNFFVTFRDIYYPGGLEPKLDRVYNSKSDFSGMFGYGWGNEYETNLKVELDGSVVVTEYGGGSDNRFVPKNYKSSDLEASVNTMVEGAKKALFISNAKQVQDYKTRITNDFDYRSKQFQLLIKKGIISHKKVAEGSQLVSTRYYYQFITKVKGGYVRVLEAGNIQKFNEAGKLEQIKDRNNNFINFKYDENGRMVQLIDNQNRKMEFSYNPQGLLEKVAGESGKSASFKYSKDGLLAYSKDDHGIENGYRYTQDNYRNIAQIDYLSDKDAKGANKKMQIFYYPPDKNSSVKSVVNTDGTINEYEYIKDAKNPNVYSVHVLLKNAAGNKISDAKYEYTSKVRAGGEVFTSKMVSTVDGEKTETNYDDKLGFPNKIVMNGRVTTMAYDQKGRMVKKVTPHESTELMYHPTLGKVSKVTKKLKSGTVLWSTFDWDVATGNLVLAKNSEKKQVKLLYSTNGLIRALVDQTGRQLTFKYNELSKPVEISDAKLGTIKITYKNSGEVDKMEGNGGASAAAEVLRALQNLIDITAPAGVTMSF